MSAEMEPNGETRKKATGLRLCTDQREQLDMLVRLTHGRKDRSDLIREAIDRYLEAKLPNLAKSV